MQEFSKKHERKSAALLMLAAFIWGTAFVSQRMGMDHMGPFTFNGIRCLVGGVFLLCCGVFLDRRYPGRKANRGDLRLLIVGGVLCGLILFVATSFQQVGMQYTSVGKAGFITALYIIVVPVIGLFMGKRGSLRLWIGVAMSLVGLYMLTMSGAVSINRGDLLVLGCALVFSFHIILVDYLSPQVDGVWLSCIQFLVSAVISCGVMFVWEKPEVAGILEGWIPILYAGVLSSGVGYTLQIIGQKGTSPTVASMIMSCESVFSVLAGWVVLGQQLSGKELFGCGLMFAAITLVQLKPKEKPCVDTQSEQSHRTLTEYSDK